MLILLKESKDGANHNHPNMASNSRGHDASSARRSLHPVPNNHPHQPPSEVCFEGGLNKKRVRGRGDWRRGDSRRGEEEVANYHNRALLVLQH